MEGNTMSNFYSPYKQTRRTSTFGALPQTESDFIKQAQNIANTQGWIMLYRFSDEPLNVFHNPINGATYYSEEEAAGAAGQRTATIIQRDVTGGGSEVPPNLEETYKAAIRQYYLDYLGREPDANGTGEQQGSWLEQVLNGQISLEEARQGIYNSKEAQRYRASHTTTGTTSGTTGTQGTTSGSTTTGASTESKIFGIPTKTALIAGAGLALVFALSGKE